MDVRFTLLLALLATATSEEWRWKSRRPSVTPNHIAKRLADSKPPDVRGTKTVENCGQTQARNIVVGDEELSHNYPWLVELLIEDLFFCSGTIISEEWVLTAAHCMVGGTIISEEWVLTAAHGMVGASKVEVLMGSSFQDSAISYDFLYHEAWNSFTLANDIALIKMPQPILFTPDIQPVCLPSYSDANDDFVGETVTTIGGSRTPGDGLCELTGTILSNVECQSYYGTVSESDSVFCTSITDNDCTCVASSGGPVNYVVDGVTQTRGVTGFGSSAGCQEGYPDLQTRVTSYLGWIEANTGIAIDS